MAYNFPDAPTIGQQVSGPGGAVYQWDGVKWITVPVSSQFVAKSGDTMTGLLTLSGNPSTSLGAAPKQYVDAGDLAAENNTGRNLIHNALFNVAQRGTGPWTTAGMTLDRWNIAFTSDTVSFGQIALGDASRTQIGDESATLALQNVFTGNAAAGAFNQVMQRIEGVRRLAGKTVTVSFWAQAASGSPKLGVSLFQSSGTGGSPTGGGWINGQNVTLGTTFARYSLTFALPSYSSYVLGSNNDNYTALAFWYSCGATNSAIAGNPGVQSATVVLWGVQLEIGPVATPLAKRDPADELALCQRFYVNGGQFVLGGAGQSGILAYWPIVFPVTMRATPTINFVGSGGSGYSAVNFVANGQLGFSATVTPSATTFGVNYAWNASADL